MPLRRIQGAVAAAVTDYLVPVRERFQELRADESALESMLADGARREGDRRRHARVVPSLRSSRAHGCVARARRMCTKRPSSRRDRAQDLEQREKASAVDRRGR